MEYLVEDGIKIPFGLAITVPKIKRREAEAWEVYFNKYSEWPSKKQIDAFLMPGRLDERIWYTADDLWFAIRRCDD